jgi:hypothetical protein
MEFSMSWISTPESSNIAGFDYAEKTRILTVEFKNGNRYNYYDVPVAVVNQMKIAPSKGQFLSQNVKGSYRYARV